MLFLNVLYVRHFAYTVSECGTKHVTVYSVHSNVAKIHSRLPAAMEFGLYVSGFWHIHAKTPRGIVMCEQ